MRRAGQIVDIDESGFSDLVSGCRIIEKDRGGPKVYLSPDDTILKVFRLKRLLSSALLLPYAIRFADNANKLIRLGVPTVEVRSIYRLRGRRQHIVAYPRLPGETLRSMLGDEHSRPRLLSAFGAYLAHLHDLGVLFRSIHFGNVIVTRPGSFALIDVTDMRFKGRPLRNWERVRNFRHLLRYRLDREALASHGEKRFVREYLAAARLAPRSASVLSTRLSNRISSLN